MTTKHYTLDEIREAFWREFHRSGELWFDYLGTEEENEQSTRDWWELFVDELEQGGRVA